MTSTETPPVTVTRADAAAMLGVSVRTIARMVNRGDLETAYTPGGQRRVLRASVEAYRNSVKDDKQPEPEAQRADTVPVTEYARLAAAYGALAQSVDAYLGAGFLGRRSARSALSDARAIGDTLFPSTGAPTAAQAAIEAAGGGTAFYPEGISPLAGDLEYLGENGAPIIPPAVPGGNRVERFGEDIENLRKVSDGD